MQVSGIFFFRDVESHRHEIFVTLSYVLQSEFVDVTNLDLIF
jgi:hypothetical protein